MVVAGPFRKCYSHCWSALNLSPGNAPSALWSSCPPELLWSSRHCDWGVLITKEKVMLFYTNLSFLFIVCAKHMKWTHHVKFMFAHLSVSFTSHTLCWLWWSLFKVTTCDTGIRYSFFFWRNKKGLLRSSLCLSILPFQYLNHSSNFMKFGAKFVRKMPQSPMSWFPRLHCNMVNVQNCEMRTIIVPLNFWSHNAVQWGTLRIYAAFIQAVYFLRNRTQFLARTSDFFLLSIVSRPGLEPPPPSSGYQRTSSQVTTHFGIFPCVSLWCNATWRTRTAQL